MTVTNPLKRHEYVAGRIPTYWIVDPVDRSVRVLELDGEPGSVHTGPFADPYPARPAPRGCGMDGRERSRCPPSG